MECIHVRLTDEFGETIALSVPCPVFTQFDGSGRADIRETFQILTGRSVEDVQQESARAERSGCTIAAGAGDRTG